MIFVYYVFFGAGWQGTTWLYNTETNSLQMRMKGASASVAAQWPVNYMVVQFTPIGIENLRWPFYLIWLFCFLLWASIPVIYVLYPETANRRLEDMDHIFNDGLTVAAFRNKDTVMVRRPEKFTRMDEEHMSRIGESVDEVDDKPMASHT